MPILQLRKVKLREVTCPKTHGWYLNLCLTLKLMLFLLIHVARRRFLEEWNVSRAKAWIRWGWAEAGPGQASLKIKA